MNAKELFTYSYTRGRRQWRAALIVYAIQTAMALIMGMQIYEVMSASIGQSLEVAKLLQGYDHTVWSDFLKVHGSSITPLIGQLRWILPFWLVISVFLNTGLLAGVSQNDTGTQGFWQGAARYFFPFLKISLLFWIFFLLWTMLVLGPTVMAMEPSLQYFQSEKGMLLMVAGMLLLYFGGVFGLFLWTLASRCRKMATNSSIKDALRQGWSLLFRRRGAFTRIFLLFGGFQVVLFFLYLGLKTVLGSNAPVWIFLLFLLQQCFVFARIQCRQMLFAGAVALSDKP